MQPVIFPKKKDDDRDLGITCGHCYMKKFKLWRHIMADGEWELLCSHCKKMLTTEMSKEKLKVLMETYG